MKFLPVCLFIVIISPTYALWAGSCFFCLQHIVGSNVYCKECGSRFATVNKDSTEEVELIRRAEITHLNYKKSLSDLLQFYLDNGNTQRSKNVNKELAALNRVPQLSVSNINTSASKNDVSPWQMGMKNIEEANILFYDANSYRKSAIGLRKNIKNLNIAALRYQRIVEKYPKSDKVSDSAYYLGQIYCEPNIEAFEKAANYFIKCYDTNPTTDKPALYNAARVYDLKLKNYKEAVNWYKQASENSPNNKYIKKSQKRLNELTVSN